MSGPEHEVFFFITVFCAFVILFSCFPLTVAINLRKTIAISEPTRFIPSDDLCPDPLNQIEKRNFSFETLESLYYKPCIFKLKKRPIEDEKEESQVVVKVELRAINSDSKPWNFIFSKKCNKVFEFGSFRGSEAEQHFLCQSRQLKKLHGRSRNRKGQPEVFLDIWKSAEGKIKFTPSADDENWLSKRYLQIIFISYTGSTCNLIRVQQYRNLNVGDSEESDGEKDSNCSRWRGEEFCGEYDCPQEVFLLTQMGFLPEPHFSNEGGSGKYYANNKMGFVRTTSASVGIVILIILIGFHLYGSPKTRRDAVHHETEVSRSEEMNLMLSSMMANPIRAPLAETPEQCFIPKFNSEVRAEPNEIRILPPSYESLYLPSYSEATKMI